MAQQTARLDVMHSVEEGQKFNTEGGAILEIAEVRESGDVQGKLTHTDVEYATYPEERFIKFIINGVLEPFGETDGLDLIEA